MSEKRKRIIFQVSFVVVALFIIELVLRLMGYQPGDIKPRWLNFHPVDSLYVIHDYYTNEEGILVADSLYWEKWDTHINEDGFRSPDFAKLDTGKKKILFIGDSFTWGMSARPVNNHCFVDLVRNETGYEVINLGIPAADPPQYAALARKYIARLKPDITLVAFFMGNDLMKEDRKIIPGEPFYYYTNAGAILADMDGRHFTSAQAAYNYFVNGKYYLRQPSGILETVVSKSSLLSRLYSARFRIKEKLEYGQLIKNTGITKKYLKQIKQLALENGAPVKFVLIPEIKEADMALDKYKDKYNDLLGDSALSDNWLLIGNEKSNFNDYPDGHLNNRGHRFYADSIESFLKNYFEHK